MAVRLALWIPLGVALFTIPRIAMATAQGPAALLTEDSRLWIYVLAPVAFALILAYVVSVYAAWMAGPARLPRVARAVVGMNRLKPMPEDGLVAHASTLSMGQRVSLAVRTIAEASILLFLALPVPALLFGHLFNPGALRLEEALIVGLCAAAEVGWIVLIVYRYLGPRFR
jgi:hypothetical protein